MKEVRFVNNNLERWKEFEIILNGSKQVDPDLLADLFVQITDDLSYANTHYPKTETREYLNNLALRAHQLIYKNKKEKRSKLVSFWTDDVPQSIFEARKHIIYSLIIFLIAAIIGAVSTANDHTFVRLILSDGYVNMTLENIKNGEPMGVYGNTPSNQMFFQLTIHNIKVSMRVFIFGILIPAIGTVLTLVYNGVMLGSFQYFFHQQDLFMTSFLTIWIHGTLEISAIIIAGGAGLKVGSSILFPDTYSRLESFKMGAKTGIKIIMGLLPVFATAGFLESYVTRLSDLPQIAKASVIMISAFIIIYYFVIYPLNYKKHGHIHRNQ